MKIKEYNNEIIMKEKIKQRNKYKNNNIFKKQIH